jgi:hypothetical protein
MILDTCSSGSAYRLSTHKGSGSLEFLTACGFSGRALSGPESFSAALCSTLKDMVAETFTISRLYDRVLRRKMILYETPFYARLPENGPEIQLQAMKAKDSVSQGPETRRTILLNVHIVPSQDGLDPMPWKD